MLHPLLPVPCPSSLLAGSDPDHFLLETRPCLAWTPTRPLSHLCFPSPALAWGTVPCSSALQWPPLPCPPACRAAVTPLPHEEPGRTVLKAVGAQRAVVPALDRLTSSGSSSLLHRGSHCAPGGYAVSIRDLRTRRARGTDGRRHAGGTACTGHRGAGRSDGPLG